ncbi:MAG: hypothetical protein KKH94_11450 [Candidatus Omnitrophica bacterium]|nr:hypothetical protein [Candidatus Omnitrophota bacterium]
MTLRIKIEANKKKIIRAIKSSFIEWSGIKEDYKVAVYTSNFKRVDYGGIGNNIYEGIYKDVVLNLEKILEEKKKTKK